MNRINKTNAPQPVRWLMAQWIGELSRVLEAFTQTRPQVEWSSEDPGRAGWSDAEALWWQQPLSAAPAAAMWVGAEADAWRDLGSRAARASGLEMPEDEQCASIWREILTQALCGLAKSLSSQCNRLVACERGQTAAPPAEAGEFARVEVIYPDGPPRQLLVGFAPALLAMINEPANLAALELLLDLELPVSISFGRAQLPLQHALKLSAGSLIELNRSVDDPVEIIVNDRVIARGEVVVVNGNYGVRIQEIASHQERLQSTGSAMLALAPDGESA